MIRTVEQSMSVYNNVHANTASVMVEVQSQGCVITSAHLGFLSTFQAPLATIWTIGIQPTRLNMMRRWRMKLKPKLDPVRRRQLTNHLRNITSPILTVNVNTNFSRRLRTDWKKFNTTKSPMWVIEHLAVHELLLSFNFTLFLSKFMVTSEIVDRCNVQSFLLLLSGVIRWQFGSANVVLQTFKKYLKFHSVQSF